MEYVYDGDTVLVADGRKVRLIGINTPELGSRGTAPEPFAEEAAGALRVLLGPRAEIGLRFDEERTDRYGRVLAHVYTKSGASVTAQLLQQGFGSVLAVPPNLWHSACYQTAERQARGPRRGVWGLPDYVSDAGTLSLDATGFRILSGRVRKLARTPRSVNLYLDGRVVVRILSRDMQYFDPRMFTKTPAYWQGRNIEVRGWLHRYKEHLYMQIRHPVALTILE